MYENESDAVRAGIEFLQNLNENDYLSDPSFNPVDLERRLNEIQADVNFLISNLPVEAIDDDEERGEEYPEDFDDSEELEDEVVECEKLIAQATELISAVRRHYLPVPQPEKPTPAEQTTMTIEPKAAKPRSARKKKQSQLSGCFDETLVPLVMILLMALIVRLCD